MHRGPNSRIKPLWRPKKKWIQLLKESKWSMKKICTQEKEKWYLQGTQSEVGGNGTDVGKWGVEEHLTFGKLSDNPTTFLISSCLSVCFSLCNNKGSDFSLVFSWNFARLPISSATLLCLILTNLPHDVSSLFQCFLQWVSANSLLQHFSILSPYFPPLSSLLILRPVLFLACIIERISPWLQCSASPLQSIL